MLIQEAASGPTNEDRGEDDKNGDGWRPGTKQRWRFHAGSGDSVIEILMIYGHVTLIDACHYPKVSGHKWHVNANGYATTTVRIDGKQTPLMLHMLLFPDIQQPHDHINKNKLDNRIENVTDGANGANQRNGPWKGTYLHPSGTGYMARWTEFGAEQESHRFFSFAKYASKAACETAARQFYEEQSQLALTRVREWNATHGPSVAIPRTKRVYARTSKIGPGLSITCKDTPKARLRARITINKILYSASWTLSLHGGKDKCEELGKKFLADTEAAHSKLPRQSRTKKAKIDEERDE
jgi:hypothetical protein